MATRIALCLAGLLLAACKGDPAPPPEDMAADPLLVARPFDLRVPASYDGSRPVPLVVLLHGYGAGAVLQDAYLGLGRLIESKGFLYALPEGLKDSTGRRFWNATDACCNLDGSDVDDVAYLRAILRDTRARYNVDPARIYLIGHSNGGFMSYRMACDASDQVAAIVSLAGTTWKDPARCQPAMPVAVLHVHGDADETIRYGGGRFDARLAEHPSAPDSVAAWARYNRCGATLEPAGERLDLVSTLDGAETRAERFPGCAGAAVELWTMEGGAHIPLLLPSFAERVYRFLTDHPRP